METAAGLLLALALAGMTFFSLVFSPLLSAKLPGETAGPSIREVCPWCLLAVAVVFAIALAP